MADSTRAVGHGGRRTGIRGRAPAAADDGERGSGLLSTTIGLGSALTMLIFASHTLVHLWTTSTVRAIAIDAAVTVATSGARTVDDRAEAEGRAIESARRQLGPRASTMSLRFEPADPRADVVLRVTGPGPTTFPGGAQFGLGAIEFSIRVPIEPLP